MRWLPELDTGDIVRTLDLVRVKVYEDAPSPQGTCLSRHLPTDVDIPPGTLARVERGKGRWGEDLIELHFDLPGFSPLSKSWTEYDRGAPRMVKVQDAKDVPLICGLPFPGKK